MSPNGFNYDVEVGKYAERHYIKTFEKKYKGAWTITFSAIFDLTKRIDALIAETDRADEIILFEEHALVKLDFAVAGTRMSPKASGDRVIIYVNKDTRLCIILLVYSKNEIGPPNETQKWQAEIKSNYPDIWEIFK